MLHDAPPQLASQFLFSAAGDVQIDPLAIRADLKFLVIPWVAGIRLQEDFRDVAIPQFVSPPIFPRVGKNRNVSIPRLKTHEQSIWRPKETNFG